LDLGNYVYIPSIPDDEYVDDPSVGARIGSNAITKATQAIYYAAQRGKEPSMFMYIRTGEKQE